ncbi:unnamed protein product [Thelazia callipaeda]|uniref:Coiled-coil domain-containing protein n=1 Tax=Thelazia callipaeda TaxID=103827 RepID=A0A0N5CMJ6_THECL|nr:unnamed protein product [Thelazia callipaeda]
MIQPDGRNKGVAHEDSNCLQSLIWNARLDVAEECRKQHADIERANQALYLLDKLEIGKQKECVSPDRVCGFDLLDEIYDELYQYTALVENFIVSVKHDTTSSAPSDQPTGSKNLAFTSTNTVHIPAKLSNYVSGCCSNHVCETLKKTAQALQNIHNDQLRCASEPGSMMHLAQPLTNALQKPPFLSSQKPGSSSHSLHATAQNLIGLLKRDIPGFHNTALSILSSNRDNYISAFFVALDRYDDRIHSKMKLLLEKYDSLYSNTNCGAIICEIDHLHKLSRSVESKRDQLLELLREPSYHPSNCPPLRQIKSLYTAFSSSSKRN